MKKILLLLFLSFLLNRVSASSADSTQMENKDYQLWLKKPAKEIHLLMYERDFIPIQGKLSDDKKSIIVKNYRQGSKIHVKVEYEDGTIDEYVKSPCYIDPVL